MQLDLRNGAEHNYENTSFRIWDNGRTETRAKSSDLSQFSVLSALFCLNGQNRGSTHRVRSNQAKKPKHMQNHENGPQHFGLPSQAI
jgi:hypothetical protein